MILMQALIIILLSHFFEEFNLNLSPIDYRKSNYNMDMEKLPHNKMKKY